ncbi:LOW QUALITY PROTEIN: pentatricopeptide repeat-containing protein At3g02330, mitochondrial-like [Macadamia integrifolia]|uniref:LOW QUALITY PROTEIN: pentatricopeptide repeat-containing protein At3g02330, mitochondrial-like n=1 Tax=Macadamia integrifolia TaxID=60698 RepID=UPI001C4FAF82|nr:LOW QUALITY PROTEIN: pentatricopeptide repeat-containing protein At3g02330, mitochondrial-like [Macadamia integrifolia]
MAHLVYRFSLLRVLCPCPKLPQINLPFTTLSTLSSNQSTPTKKKTFSHIFQDCADQRSLDVGKQAHAYMITSGFSPTIFVSNCLIYMYIKCSDIDYASKVFELMRQRDTVSWNAMIFGYAGSGAMALAQSIFDLMLHRDVISWNSLISGYLQNGNFQKPINLFLQMRVMGMVLDRTTFAIVLKSCSALEACDLGVQIHCLIIKMGFDCDVVTGSSLVDMYAKCMSLNDSHKVFLAMPERNWVSWSAIIAGCVQNDQLVDGLHLFKEMQKAGIGASQSTYASVFRLCGGLPSLRLGSQMHGHALKNNFGYDVIVGTAILDMYAKCDFLIYGRRVFNRLPMHNLQSWNAIIVGYARNGQGFEALQLFQLMQRSGVGMDEISLSGVFSACAVTQGLLEGLQIHGLAIKSGFESNICVTNAILDMYGKCGALVEAHGVFDLMDRRDAISWNAIIAAYEQNGCEEETLFLFSSMLHSRLEPDEFTYGSILKACAGAALNYGKEIHGRVIKSGLGLDLFVGGALVDMYSKCGTMDEAEKLHDKIENQTMVSWNSIISGYSLQKQSEEAQKFFSRMLEMGLQPDNFTYATVLDNCANLATIGLGKQIHAQIIKQDLIFDVFISSTLVDMYSKCGNMQDSRLMFEKMPERDFVSWNAMISGYAQHGLGEEALKIFEKMQLENVKPNHATFVAVLRACGFVGLVEKGLHYFHLMLQDYGLDPQLEHYSCMVDIIGRSGKVDEALKLISEMPFEADAVIWRTLLSVCQIHRNVEVAEQAARSILELDPQDSAAYVLLSNIYAEAGMWGEVSKIRKMMKQNRLKKEPGCSWLEVQSKMNIFLVGDKAHPKCKEIYEMLDELIREMKWVGYVPDVDFVLADEEAEQHEQCEELAFFW